MQGRFAVNITVLTYEPTLADRDPVIPQVMAALADRGHRPTVLAVHDDVQTLLEGIRVQRPELIVNLLEMFADDVFGDVSMAGLLELTGVPFTGGGPGDLYLAQDKALGKKLLAFAGIAYPRFAVFGLNADLETGGNLRMPLFVKPLRMDASLGIDARGLVQDARGLLERVALIHDECNDSALAEEYIDGREFYVGVLGNRTPQALPPIEMDFTGLPAGAPRILDRKAKWDQASPEYAGTRAVVASVPDDLRGKLQRTAVEAYRALQVRDYGRVDLRVTASGDVYVLEVNANCYLDEQSEFAMSAVAAGLSYADLIDRIVHEALERRRAPRPITERPSRASTWRLSRLPGAKLPQP